ncbi:metallophosphoesterase family protein [Actinokineospora fastidiosa]|uniref:Metallophosphoesterase n=1 Tax=Actinokineospora fastidiosa TaxID=1816 RepID=A0A918LFJ3_9PSEU|nr:metallophosphoesterase [Actinokineospora fastidiosa]GGS40477.1 metallophosphoesterase [Actinokineospora fastidiosa]
MRVHVVSDVHGNVEALKRAGDGADALVVLGDLIDFVDYHDHGAGIFGRVFGPDAVGVFARLRRDGKPGEAGAYARTLWSGLSDARVTVEEAVREQYAALFAALPAPTYATPGNVDLPALWPEFAGDGVQVLDGGVAEIGGLRFGFVGGAVLPPGMRPPPRTAVFRAYLREPEEYDAAVAALPPVDVLCSHAPPDLPELTYDVVARRVEHGSAGLVARILADRPRWALFGHVHQPLCRRLRFAATECANVGHFKRAETPYVLRW